MGAFVLGVLIGWFTAWTYYTFWLKPAQNNEMDSLKTDQELKSRQIASLQSQISSASESQQNSTDTNKPAEKTASLKSTSGGTSYGKKTVNNSSKTSPNAAIKKSSQTKSTSNKNLKTAKANENSTKVTPISKRKTKIKGDDFTKLSGIGPSMSASLKSLGIDTFEKLAATDDNVLRDKLEASGARMNNNKEVMDSWNEQATLAANGNFTALKEMQAALKK